MKKGLVQASGIVGTCLSSLSLLIMVFVIMPISFFATAYEYYEYDYYYYDGIGLFWFMLIIALIFIVASLVGSIRLIAISNKPKEKMNKSKTEVLVWAIVFIFTNLISSVLAFIAYGSTDDKKEVETKKEEEPASTSDLELRLKELKRLKDEGLISKEDFDKKKEKILDI